MTTFALPSKEAYLPTLYAFAWMQTGFFLSSPERRPRRGEPSVKRDWDNPLSPTNRSLHREWVKLEKQRKVKFKIIHFDMFMYSQAEFLAFFQEEESYVGQNILLKDKNF
jgi:hypothetical protein